MSCSELSITSKRLWCTLIVTVTVSVCLVLLGMKLPNVSRLHSPSRDLVPLLKTLSRSPTIMGTASGKSRLEASESPLFCVLPAVQGVFPADNQYGQPRSDQALYCRAPPLIAT